MNSQKKRPFPSKNEKGHYNQCYIVRIFNFWLGGNFSNKIVDDFDFLNFLPIDLLNLTDHDFLDKTVQHNFVQLLDGGIFADFLNKGMPLSGKSAATALTVTAFCLTTGKAVYARSLFLTPCFVNGFAPPFSH